MTKWIWFDVDGTWVDLYGVENWLDYLINENTLPYAIAKPLINLSAFARILHKLQKNGYKIGIVTWLSKNASVEYEKAVADTKKAYFKKHLPSVKFDAIDILPYGTPKEENRTGILFDDEKPNRDNWNGEAFDEKNLLENLKALCFAEG